MDSSPLSPYQSTLMSSKTKSHQIKIFPIGSEYKGQEPVLRMLLYLLYFPLLSAPLTHSPTPSLASPPSPLLPIPLPIISSPPTPLQPCSKIIASYWSSKIIASYWSILLFDDFLSFGDAIQAQLKRSFWYFVIRKYRCKGLTSILGKYVLSGPR